MTGMAQASSTIGIVHLVNGSGNAEGGIVGALTVVAPSATDVRLETKLNLADFTIADTSGTYFYVAILDSSISSISAKTMATTRVISQFQGLLLEIHFGQSTITVDLFYSATKVSSFSMSGSANSVCPTFSSSLLATSENMASGDNWLALQVSDDYISASIQPLAYNKLPAYMYSNLNLAGFGNWLKSQNATVHILQYNPLGSNVKIKIEQTRFFANAQPMALASKYTKNAELMAEIQTMLASTSSETHFPIPELTKGHPQPLVKASELSDSCEYILPNVRAPNDANSTDIYMSFTIDRLLEIKDLEETISISATMYLQWGVFTCDKNTTAENVEAIERIIVSQPEAIWHPVVSISFMLRIKMSQFYKIFRSFSPTVRTMFTCKLRIMVVICKFYIYQQIHTELFTSIGLKLEFSLRNAN